jgi:hypothetical protein
MISDLPVLYLVVYGHMGSLVILYEVLNGRMWSYIVAYDNVSVFMRIRIRIHIYIQNSCRLCGFNCQ